MEDPHPNLPSRLRVCSDLFMRVTRSTRTTDAQVRRLREEMAKHGKIGKAAMRADMCENTARKRREGSGP